jgi:superfamily II DNA helicase RecQ
VIAGASLTLRIHLQVTTLQAKLRSCRASKMSVGRLLTVQEAKDQQLLCASDYLCQLCNKSWPDKKALILFTTPELVQFNLASLRKLAEQKKLRQIVVDEFDVIAECKNNYRPAYLNLVRELRLHCWPFTTFLFLSATATKQSILEVLPEDSSKKMQPYLFLSKRPLLDNHIHVSNV